MSGNWISRSTTGSGKWLDHLIARYGIDSKWPGLHELERAEGHVFRAGAVVRDGGAYSGERSQRGGAGRDADRDEYILAFHEDQPAV